MPAPHAVLPKTHSIIVNLDQIITNVERATTYVFEIGRRPYWFFENAAPSEKYHCHIDTVNELRDFLPSKPEMTRMHHHQKQSDGKMVHFLVYENKAKVKQLIRLTATSILNTHTSEHCSINLGLSHYLGVGLDIHPPSPSPYTKDLTMIGYIRCFGAGHMDCPQFMDFATPTAPPPYAATAAAPIIDRPEVPPSIEPILKMNQLSNSASYWKLKYLYMIKVVEYARSLVSDLYWNSELDAATAAQLMEATTRHTPRLTFDHGKTEEETVSRVNSELQKFLNALFQTAAWRSQYHRFGKDFLQMGCNESQKPGDTLIRVTCPEHGVTFDAIAPNTDTRLSQKVAR